MLLELFFDGACDNTTNGPGGLGAWITFGNMQYGDKVYALSFFSESTKTSNQAEWGALIEGLKLLSRIHLPDKKLDVKVYGDSKLVVNQFNRRWKTKNRSLMKLRDKAHSVVRSLKASHHINSIKAYWIPRDDNQFADDLSKYAIAEHHVEWNDTSKEKISKDISAISGRDTRSEIDKILDTYKPSTLAKVLIMLKTVKDIENA